MYKKKQTIYRRKDSDDSNDSGESSVYRIKNRDERDDPRQQIQQSEPQIVKKYVVINREGDEEEDDLEQQPEIFLPEVRTQEEIMMSQSFIQQKNQQDQERQSKCNEVQETKQQIKKNHNRYITRKQIVGVLETKDVRQIVAELEKINQWGLLSKSIDNIDITRFRDMTEKFLEIFYILMEDPQNNYIYYIEEIFKSTQMLAQLKKLLESNRDKEKERLYSEFFSSTLEFLKISSNINIIPIDEVIAQYKIDKSLCRIARNYENDILINNIRELHTEKLDKENREKQKKEVQKQRSEIFQQMYGIRIDYKECPSEPTELDFQFHNNEPKPPFGQLFPVVQEGGYLSNELFINNHFYILREDYLQLFRKALWHLKQLGFYNGVQEVIKDVFVYENIILNSMSIDRQGLQVELEITPYQMAGRQPQKINWNITKRLMTGALVMFTDNEQSVKNIFFTVIKKQAERENSQSVKVQLKLINGLLSSLIELVSLLKSGKYVYLIENKVFYDPYIHFLNCLKQIDVNKIPFKDIIVAQNNIDVKPLYLQKAYDRNYAIDYNICLKMNLNTQNLNYSGKRIHLYDPWPQKIYETLDKSQVEAIQLMLRQGIGIVQGPPGTGKTFCGALAVRILQNNRNFIDRGAKDMEHNRPILIVCYTNHALDQFLKHILAFTDKSKVVRIGGRCQDEEIQELLLQKQERTNPHFPFKDFYSDRDYLQKQFLNQTKSNEIEFRLTKQNYKKDIISICKGFLQLQNVKYQNFYMSDLTQEYIFNLWLNYDCYSLKLIHYLVVEQLEARVDNNIVSINNRGYQKNNYQHYSIGFLDERQINQQQQQRQQLVRGDQEEEDDVQLTDEEEDRQLYQKYDDEPELDIQQDYRRRINTRESKYQRQNNKQVFDDIESKLNKEPQSQKYQQTINSRKLCDVWDNKIELLHKFYKLKFEQLGQEFQAEFDAFMATSRQLQDLYMEQDLGIIQSKQIVGLTVTGCAKYAKHLDKLKFGIMIIEEAAEVLESHTIAILSKNVEHLILIGDHQQLRPKLENYMIEKKYKTNISLFERLINNGINFVTLSNQRRMRTDFANIIRLIYGNEYQDHPQIYQQNQVQIKGLKHHLVFFDHQNNEKNHLDFQSSKCNEFESGMITNLVKYLIANEYASTQITVLSMYIKQVQDIKKQFLKERITGVKIQTVDNYQGEENDIIILSLVRSNNKMQLGFVGIDNRVCVALSRARIGLYVFGDFQFIKSSVEKNITKNRNNSSDLWIRIINHVKQSKNLMEQLVLQCQSHKTETIITKLPEWRNSVHGGCQLVCNIRFDCGHVCKLKCHQLSHTKKNCPEVCETKLQCGHKCASYCRVIPCPPCKTIVQKFLRECRHYQNAECHLKEDQIFCKSQCKRFLECQHPCPLLCGNDCSDAQCMVQINVRLGCNHIKTINCVDITNPKRCLCEEIINKFLKCGHVKQIMCQDKSLEQQCEDKCKKILQCGHLCKQKCYQNCQMFPCKEKVNQTRNCGHQIIADCHNKHIELAQACQVIVTKTLDCGHKKEIKCHQMKDKFICLEPIQISTGLCQHEFTTTCNKRNDSFSEYQCEQPCYEILDCGDQCLQLCQRCINLGFHTICKRTIQHQTNYGQIGCMSEIVEDAKEIHSNVLKDLKKLKKSPLYQLIKEEDTTYFEPHQVEVARFQIKFGQQFIDLQEEFDDLDDLYFHVLELIQLPNLFQLLSKKLYVEFKQKFCYAVCFTFDVIDMKDCLKSYKDIQNDQIGRILKLLKGQKKCLNELACGHRCKQEFHLNLINCVCEVEYTKKLDCGHDKTYLCSEKNSFCQVMCQKQLNCGHQCEEICHKGNCQCEKQKIHLLNCQNHQMMIKCKKLEQLQNQIECDQLCKFRLPCGHICNSKCGECVDNIHNLCQTKVPGKYGQNVYCGQDIYNRSQNFFFQNKPDVNNIIKSLKSNQNWQVQQFYQNLLDKNIAFNLTQSQSIILQKQIDLMIVFVELDYIIIQENTKKINIINNILFSHDLYLRANQVYMDQLSQAIYQLQKPKIRMLRRIGINKETIQ